jgi:CheY-like chemotaxis protein
MKNLSVLIVDDDRQTRGLMEAIFSRLKWNIAVARDGDEALKILREKKFDLLFTDNNMPGMLGKELAGTVKIVWPEIKIIMATGDGLDELKQAVGLNIDVILQKPFNLNGLYEALENLFP